MRRERLLAVAVRVKGDIGTEYGPNSVVAILAGEQVALCDAADLSGLDPDELAKITDLRRGAASLREDRQVFIRKADAAFLVGRVLQPTAAARQTDEAEPETAPAGE